MAKPIFYWTLIGLVVLVSTIGAGFTLMAFLSALGPIKGTGLLALGIVAMVFLKDRND